MKISHICLTCLMLVLPQLSTANAQVPPTLPDKHLTELIDQADAIAISEALQANQITSLALTQAYLKKISQLNPMLNAVISINPKALEQASDIDKRRQMGEKLHPIAGIPVLIKDNIDITELPTTAGSLALADNYTERDAAIITNLRARGAILLGKTNLSEWANFRSEHSTSGWSAVGGQTRNPHDFDRSPCGSSSGSAVAIAARLAPLAIGTETNGSIICPASVNGVVGFKPSIGQLPQMGIVPIAHTQDTAGPLANSVASANLLFQAMQAAESSLPLQPERIQGKRIGVIRSATGYHTELDEQFQLSLGQLEQSGAIVIDGLLLEPSYAEFQADSYLILLWEFQQDLKAYFNGLSNPLSSLDLDKVIAFNQTQSEQELALFPQDIFEKAAALTKHDKTTYLQARQRALAETRHGLRALFKEYQLDAIIAPTIGPAWPIDYEKGDVVLGGFSTYPAVAGFPHISLPMGEVSNLPVGLSISHLQGQDNALINLAASVESILNFKVKPDLPDTN
ncbi:MAG: hypothetical protein HOJ61_18350 [Gammaproteobacteria bacterium]|nr:hypothetical protein [Gammaproteobacteria bacterium]